MAATLTEFIKKCGTIYVDGNATKSNKQKFNAIGCHYATLNGFKNASMDDFNNLTTIEGERCFSPLTPKERQALLQLQNDCDTNLSLEQNFIKILTKDFIRKQAKAIDNITIEELNANPLLCRALKLNTPEEFIKFYAYSALSRSIVTSMGYLVQDLMLYSNTNVYDGKNYPESYGTKWDVVIEGLDGVRSYIEVKSGPNDMDKTQILSYDKAIKKVLEHNEKAFFGITYGKPDGNYVSTSILETYVENWRDKTLMGKELWDYISGNESYHEILMNTIQETAEAFLGNESLIERIDNKIETLLADFLSNYGSIENFYNSLW